MSVISQVDEEILKKIIISETSVSSKGFPYLNEKSFHLFIEKVPHLFAAGQCLLSWLEQFEKQHHDNESTLRAIQVIRTMCYTAAITATPDLWLLAQILTELKRLNLISTFLEGKSLSVKALVQNGLDEKHIRIAFDLFMARGYLVVRQQNFKINDLPQVWQVFKSPLIFSDHDDVFSKINNYFSTKQPSHAEQDHVDQYLKVYSQPQSHIVWIAGIYEVELGFRFLPLVLALRVHNFTKGLKMRVTIKDIVPSLTDTMSTLCQQCGVIDQGGKVTELGERVFDRGPGPFGIIHSYRPYLIHLESLMRGQKKDVWVLRRRNVALSQDANRRAFKEALDTLERFCKDTQFSFNVFIEHAVGQGEATRQYYAKNVKSNIQYFGADLEDDAINAAVEQQKLGHLPKNMIFIRKADIGQPDALIQGVMQHGFSVSHAVMVVGNGFHEIRNQTNEKMIGVFSQYERAGIILVFTEESALSNKDLLTTAWNTYHTAFRYVHELSGQGLRPALDKHDDQKYSWRKCATIAGYIVLDKYTVRSRTIFPYPRKDGYNPSISVTYFCVPKSLKSLIKKLI